VEELPDRGRRAAILRSSRWWRVAWKAFLSLRRRREDDQVTAFGIEEDAFAAGPSQREFANENLCASAFGQWFCRLRSR